MTSVRHESAAASLTGATDALPGAPMLRHHLARLHASEPEGDERSVEELTASLAHGLNNLLGAVVGQAAELLAAIPGDPGGDETRRSGLRLIHQSALDATGLVRRLVSLGRGETLDDIARSEIVDLGHVLTNAIELTRSRWQDRAAAREPVVVTVEIEQPLLVRAVAADLREIVVNLIFNAVDAMPNGGRLLLCGDVRDGTVRVTCQDNGIGMTPDVLAHVFDPFFTTKGRHGNGLGLAIVRDVVVRLGGEVQVVSEHCVGTTFTLLLPAAEPAADLAELVLDFSGLTAASRRAPPQSGHRRRSRRQPGDPLDPGRGGRSGLSDHLQPAAWPGRPTR